MKLWPWRVVMILLLLVSLAVHDHLKMMALSDGIVFYTRIRACRDSKTVESYLHPREILQGWGCVSLLFSAHLAHKSPSFTYGIWTWVCLTSNILANVYSRKVVYFQCLSASLLHYSYTTYSTVEKWLFAYSTSSLLSSLVNIILHF